MPLASFFPPVVGGSEGIAMLNRTNRTLSANLNGLNLGTRSFVVKASAINGNPTPRIPHAHHCAMRDGIMITIDPMIQSPSWIVRSWIPCSSVGSSWPVPHAAKVEPVLSESRWFHVDRIEPTLVSKRETDVRPVGSKRGDRFLRPQALRPFAQPRMETYQGFQQGFLAKSQSASGRATSGGCLASANAAARG